MRLVFVDCSHWIYWLVPNPNCSLHSQLSSLNGWFSIQGCNYSLNNAVCGRQCRYWHLSHFLQFWLLERRYSYSLRFLLWYVRRLTGNRLGLKLNLRHSLIALLDFLWRLFLWHWVVCSFHCSLAETYDDFLHKLWLQNQISNCTTALASECAWHNCVFHSDFGEKLFPNDEWLSFYTCGLFSLVLHLFLYDSGNAHFTVVKLKLACNQTCILLHLRNTGFRSRLWYTWGSWHSSKSQTG